MCRHFSPQSELPCADWCCFSSPWTIQFSFDCSFFNIIENKKLINNIICDFGVLNNELIVHHLVFTSEVKIGRLTTITGETVEVDENYEPTDYDNIEWKWVKQLWEGYIVADRFYLGFQPLPLQRAKFENPYSDLHMMYPTSLPWCSATINASGSSAKRLS